MLLPGGCPRRARCLVYGISTVSPDRFAGTAVRQLEFSFCRLRAGTGTVKCTEGSQSPCCRFALLGIASQLFSQCSSQQPLSIASRLGHVEAVKQLLAAPTRRTSLARDWELAQLMSCTCHVTRLCPQVPGRTRRAALR
eukprot:407535-Rhodomonas_salina.2